MSTNSPIIKCCTCQCNKKNTFVKKVGNKFFDFCPDCWSDMLWTRKVLENGTNWLVNKYPEKYAKMDQISVVAV